MIYDYICLCIETLELDVETNALKFTNQKQMKRWKPMKTMGVSTLWEPTLTCADMFMVGSLAPWHLMV